MVRFSIILPSYLGPYSSAGTNRDQKLIRAVNSVLGQIFEDFEVHVIADGCQQTIDIIQNNISDSRVKLWLIERTKLWSGKPRNKGLDEAEGEYIVYLDNDDIYGANHLQIINEGINGYDWIWYNDIHYNPHLENWYERQCNIKQIGMHGTSNICHKQSLDIHWDIDGRYAHDYYFIQKLLKFTNFTKIQTPEYYVCHIPGTKSSGGYDL